MMHLDEAELAVLDDVARAGEALSRWDSLEGRFGGKVVAGLCIGGVLEAWFREDGCFVTLTPMAASAMGLEIGERWKSGTEQRPDPGRPLKTHPVRVMEEIPVWRHAARDERGLPVLTRRVNGRKVEGVVWKPRYGEPGCSLLTSPGQAPAPPIPRLFAGPEGDGVGIPVTIDRRMK